MFEEFVQNHRPSMVDSLQHLLQIDSVKGEPVTESPFGSGPARALEYMLQLGTSFGFSVKNLDGYVGYIEYGEGDEYIAVASHLDVVPTGTGWTYPPFGAEIHNGKIYARGAIDDKGPAMSTFWALVALKAAGFQPTRKIRLIFGLDEESDWECMNYYFRKEPKPLGGFTPDSDFPLIYAEKGLATFQLSIKVDLGAMGPRVIKFTGGSRVNMVPDYAYAVIDCVSETAAHEWEQTLFKTAKLKQIETEVSVFGSKIHIVVHGIAAHASTPDAGRNAIVYLAMLLNAKPIANGIMWRFIASQTTTGNGLGIECQDEISGFLTANLGKAELNNDEFHFYFNVRFPVNEQVDALLVRCQEYLPHKWSARLIESMLPLYVPLDSPVVETLLHVYREATGDMTEPLAMGGATYARTIPNGIAFGALYPGQADMAHQKDEYWQLDDYYRAVQIYAQAMMELANTL